MKNLTLSLFASFLALSSLDAHAGGRFILQGNKAHLYFNVVIYSDKATARMAQVLEDSTNRAWSGRGLLDSDQAIPQSITHLGQTYEIEPHIQVSAMNEATGQAAALANTDRTINYFHLNYGRNGGGSVSYVPDLGTSCGYLEINMQLDTLAHEMGHNLRLSHRSQSGARPPLMYPWVNINTVLQSTDVNQITLPAPSADGSFTIGRLCTPAETMMTESEEGDYWDLDGPPVTPSISGIQLFPNPALRGQTIHARFEASVEMPAEVQILDLLGQKLSSTRITAVAGTNTIRLSSQNLVSSGAYIVRIARPGAKRGEIPTAKLLVQ